MKQYYQNNKESWQANSMKRDATREQRLAFAKGILSLEGGLLPWSSIATWKDFLEVVVAADLSGDETLRKEVRDKLDFHQLNQDRFGLPSRVVAKRFKFKLLYGATAYGYAHDSDFIDVSTSEKYWQGIIDEYYDKYRGIKKWHEGLINHAKRHGQLEIPSGRFYPIAPDENWKWPITVIKNYPVQGFGADLVMLARLQAMKELKHAKLRALLISTIHDSVVADCPDDEVEEVGRILNLSVESVPSLCRMVFGYDFSLPLTAEVQYGKNKKNMQTLSFSWHWYTKSVILEVWILKLFMNGPDWDIGSIKDRRREEVVSLLDIYSAEIKWLM